MSVFQMARFIRSRGKDVSKYSTSGLNKNVPNFISIERQIIHIWSAGDHASW